MYVVNLNSLFTFIIKDDVPPLENELSDDEGGPPVGVDAAELADNEASSNDSNAVHPPSPVGSLHHEVESIRSGFDTTPPRDDGASTHSGVPSFGSDEVASGPPMGTLHLAVRNHHMPFQGHRLGPVRRFYKPNDCDSFVPFAAAKPLVRVLKRLQPWLMIQLNRRVVKVAFYLFILLSMFNLFKFSGCFTLTLIHGCHHLTVTSNRIVSVRLSIQWPTFTAWRGKI